MDGCRFVLNTCTMKRYQVLQYNEVDLIYVFIVFAFRVD